jgi:asparagine synthase (glutamine-hydrolysing)
MCGILVSVNNACHDRHLFLQALEVLNHRGPDSSAVLQINQHYFGFVRLEIIDCNNRSMQPFKYGNTTLIINGEIYNYRELKQELKSCGVDFQTEGDAEVAAAAIEVWGAVEAFKKFSGMWSLVAHDSRDNTLTISRDRLGMKPLWWVKSGEGFIFSSEIKSLIKLNPELISINHHLENQFLVMGVQGENNHSLYKNIEAVPPGNYVKINEKTSELQFKPYWKIVASELKKFDVEVLEDLLEKVMYEHLSCDVGIGLALSGGVDSSIIAEYLKKYNINANFYSLSHPIADLERPLIKKTVDDLKLQHEFINTMHVENLETIDAVIKSIDQPFRATQTLYQYAIRKAAKKDGVKVLLTGDGADEVFGGYSYSVPYAIAGLLKREKLSEAESMAISMSEFTGATSRALMDSAKSVLIESRNHFAYLKRVPKVENRDYLSWVSPLDCGTEVYGINSLKSFLSLRLNKTPIPYWLNVEDGISMKNSIETRLPFLDHRLIDYAFSVDEKYFFNNGVNKSMLRSAAKKYIPMHISAQRVKFQRPGSAENFVFGRMFDEILEVIANSDIEYINRDKCIDGLLRDRRNLDQANADFWFRMFTLCRWRTSLKHFNADRK